MKSNKIDDAKLYGSIIICMLILFFVNKPKTIQEHHNQSTVPHNTTQTYFKPQMKLNGDSYAKRRKF